METPKTIEEIRKQPNVYEVSFPSKVKMRYADYDDDENYKKIPATIELIVGDDYVQISDTDGDSVRIMDKDAPMLIAKLKELYPEGGKN